MSDLWLPASVVEELAEQRAQEQAAQERQFNFFGFAGTRTPIQSLGGQPSHRSLLQEIKGWVAIAGAAIARRVRGLEVEVAVDRMRDGSAETEILDDHPLKGVLDNPNPIFSRGDMLWLLVWHVLQTGEAFWHKVRDGVGITRQLWPLPPQNILLVPSETEVIAGYVVRDGQGREQSLPREDVIRFWNPDPSTLYSAMGTLGPMATEYDAGRFREEHVRALFEKDATPRTVIIGKDGSTAPTPEQRNDFYTKWRQGFNRRLGEHNGLPAFIPPGFDVKELSAHGGATEVLGFGESTMKQILAAYGVPGSIVGMVQDVNRAAAETNHFVFDRNTVKPITDLISEALTRQCAREFDPRLRTQFADFIAPDKEFLLKRENQDAVNGVRSVQQILRDRNDDPNDAPWGELPVMPLGVGPYTGEEPVDELGPEDPEDLRLARGEQPDGLAVSWLRFTRAERQFTGRFQKAMLSVFDAQLRETAKRLKQTPPRARAQGSDYFDPDEWEPLMRRRIQPLRQRAYVQTAEDAFKSVSDSAFSLSDAAAEEIERQGVRLARDVNRATLAKVDRIVRRGAANGDTVAKITKDLSPVLRNRKRARTVARTEVLRATQSGQLQGFKQSGAVRGMQWNTALDADVRDSHAIDGQQQPLGKPFELNSGALAQHPGDPSLFPEDVVNCRCFLSPILLEDD